MNTAHLPDFSRTLAIAQGNLDAAELSECHGVACGLLVRLSNAGTDAYIDLLDTLQLVIHPGAGLTLSLEEVLNASRLQLADEEMGLTLWLPADEETLEDRTMALSQWCMGFLAGIGSAGPESLQALSEEGNEALKDLQQISTADVTDTTESEEDEIAFTEIVEYMRVVILMIMEDLRGPEELELIH